MRLTNIFVFQERVQIASQTSSVTDISGLSQNLLEEKNQEIDHLSEQVTRLTTELEELKSDKGVENMVSNLILDFGYVCLSKKCRPRSDCS